MLGKLCLTGQGQPRDQAKAMVWFSRSAAQGNQYAQFFLEQRNDLHPPSVMLAVTRLLYHMSRIFRDNSMPPRNPAGIRIDSKRPDGLAGGSKAQAEDPGEEDCDGPQAG